MIFSISMMNYIVNLLVILAFSSQLVGGVGRLSPSSTLPMKAPAIRFLEGNSFQLHIAQTHFLIDPVMTQLDFNIPWLYRGNKRVIDGEKELSEALAYTDVVLITQVIHQMTCTRYTAIILLCEVSIASTAVSIFGSHDTYL